MNSDGNSLKLRNGVEMPVLGFGTSRFGHREKITDERCKDCIKHALEIGYIHFFCKT